MADGRLNTRELPDGPDRRTILKSLAVGTLGTLATSTATAGETNSIQNSTEGIGPVLIEKNESAGFNFPYYLYSPQNVREKPLLVEPVNSGGCDDDFQVDLDAGERLISGGVPRQISDELRIPLLIPVFANPCEGEFWDRFIQTLDTETMHIESGRFERIDLQLLRMIEDAQKRLASDGIDLPEEIMMNGFSASGNFVNNFSVLHPDRVASVTAGAINGMATLPKKEAMGRTVNYQIGVADIDELTDSPFNKQAWREVPQFCYMGEDERSPNDDTLPYRDVWSEEQAQLARTVYGDNMQSERMVYSEAVYHGANAPGRFEVYDNTGHTYSDQIINDVISFHRRHNQIESGNYTRTPAAGMDYLSFDVLVTSDSADQLVARAFVNGSEVTAEPVAILSGVSMEPRIELTEALSVDDTVTVGVFETDSQQLSDARLTVETNVEAEARFTTEPEPGNKEVEVSYALSTSADSSATLSLVPAGDGQYWQRRIRLKNIRPGDNGTETFQLDTSNVGIPIQSGDEIELWLIPSGNQVPERAIATETINVGDDDSDPTTDQLQASSCDENLEHEAVDVSLVGQPTVGEETVKIEYAVDASFGQRARLRLFPETGGGQWGEGLDFVDAGSSGVKTYDLPPNILTAGETVEVRAFPGDWRNLDDVIATDCAIVGGVQFEKPPSTGDSGVTIRYSYPGDVAGKGYVDLVIDDSVVSTIKDISPGTFQRQTISVDSIQGDTDVTVRLNNSDDTQIDTVSITTWPDDHATVQVVDGPERYDRSLSLEYGLSPDHDVDRFCTLRLYNDLSSSWGILLDQVQPGDSATETVDISVDEPGVPFKESAELKIALVNWDDPYATRPLAETMVTVGETVENETGDGTDGGTPNSEKNTETQSNSESDDGTGESANDNETVNEAEDERNDQTGSSEESPSESGGSESNSEASPGVTDTASSSEQSNDDGIPALGIGGLIAGLGGVGYLLRQRLILDNDQHD